MRKLISLGYRCDVAFQLRMHSGDNTSHFFDWLATPTAGLIKVFSRRFDVFQPDHLVRTTLDGREPIVDRLTGVTFWHQFPITRGVAATPHQLFYPAFASKFAYLARRFADTVQSHPVTLVRSKINQRDARLLEAAFFRMFPGVDTNFLYVVTNDAVWQTANGRSVCMAKSRRSLGDPVAWARMLVREGLVDQPYRLSTGEILGYQQDVLQMAHGNRFTRAELVAAVEAHPQSCGLRTELAHVCLVQGDLPAAAEQLTKASAFEPPLPGLAVDLAVVEWRLGRLTAKQAAARITGVPLTQVQQQQQLISMLIEAERLGEAYAACNALLRQNPMDANLSFVKAQVCLRQGRLNNAEYAIDYALSLEPGERRYKDLRAQVMAASGRADTSLQHVEAIDDSGDVDEEPSPLIETEAAA